MFKKYLLKQIAVAFTSCLLASIACAQTSNTLTPQEKADGWQLLFNGKNLDGWHSYHQNAPGKDWTVQDGAIQLERGRTGDEKDFADLVSNAEYENFDLKLEWKMTPCADSGVMFYVHESPKYHETYETGPEMQIADLACTKPDSRVLNERSGDLFDLISSDVEWVNEAPQWNQFEIIANKGHVQFFQNGHKVVDTYFVERRLEETGRQHQVQSMARFRHLPPRSYFPAGYRGQRRYADTPLVPEYKN